MIFAISVSRVWNVRIQRRVDTKIVRQFSGSHLKAARLTCRSVKKNWMACGLESNEIEFFGCRSIFLQMHKIYFIGILPTKVFKKPTTVFVLQKFQHETNNQIGVTCTRISFEIGICNRIRNGINRKNINKNQNTGIISLRNAGLWSAEYMMKMRTRWIYKWIVT